MRLEQMLNSTGSSLVADFDSQINRQLGVASVAQSNKNAQVQASKNWGKAAWEDSESKWRKGNFDNFYNNITNVKMISFAKNIDNNFILYSTKTNPEKNNSN